MRPMKVLRIVPNVPATDVALAERFYGQFLGLKIAMDLGWIATYESTQTMNPQVSVASEGGSGTEVPALSVEVDDLDEALARAEQFGITVEYGPVQEAWGVRRFYVHDPFGQVVNIVAHR